MREPWREVALLVQTSQVAMRDALDVLDPALGHSSSTAEMTIAAKAGQAHSALTSLLADIRGLS